MFSSRQQPNNMRPFPPHGMTRQPPTVHPHHVPGSRQGQGGLQGILQRFLKPKAPSGFHGAPGMQGFSPPVQGGEKFAGMLGNLQQAIKLAQTATPLIQQYGPVVKNLPMMLSMIKALNEEETEDAGDATLEKEKQPAQLKEETLNKIETNTQQRKRHFSSKSTEGTSKPKLFI